MKRIQIGFRNISIGSNPKMDMNSMRQKKKVLDNRSGVMYICNCNGLRESDVNALKTKDVFRQLGAKPQCGKCIRDIVKTIRKNRNAKQ